MSVSGPMACILDFILVGQEEGGARVYGIGGN